MTSNGRRADSLPAIVEMASRYLSEITQLFTLILLNYRFNPDVEVVFFLPATSHP